MHDFIVFVFLAILSIYDIKFKKIPNLILITMLFITIFSNGKIHTTSLILWALFVVLYIYDQIGGGDIKLLFVIALNYPLTRYYLIMLYAVIAVTIYYVFRNKEINEIQLTPFLLIGFVLSCILDISQFN